MEKQKEIVKILFPADCQNELHRKEISERKQKIMKILALDSSGLVASVAVVENDTLLAEYTVNYKKHIPRLCFRCWMKSRT